MDELLIKSSYYPPDRLSYNDISTHVFNTLSEMYIIKTYGHDTDSRNPHHSRIVGSGGNSGLVPGIQERTQSRQKSKPDL